MQAFDTEAFEWLYNIREVGSSYPTLITKPVAKKLYMGSYSISHGFVMYVSGRN